MCYCEAPPIPMLSDAEFERRLNREYRALSQYARKLLPHSEEAQDLLQDTLLRVWEKRGQYREDTHFDRWCRRVMRRRFLNLVQRDRERRMTKVSLQDTLDESQSSTLSSRERHAQLALLRMADYRTPEHICEAEQVRRFIDERLPPPVATVVKLRLQGYRYASIAAMLGISQGTARVRYFDARQVLKNWLNDGPAVSSTL